jgi:hypothetical protein
MATGQKLAKIVERNERFRDGGVATDATLIERELRALRKGRAVMAHGLAERLGTRLCRTFEIDSSDDDTSARNKVVSGLRAGLRQLPDALATAAAAALAVHRDTTDLLILDRRVDWLAARLAVSDRTARRRMDEALRLLAGQLAEQRHGQPEPDESWYVSSLRARFLLDRPQPYAIEERRIVATADLLSEIIHRASIPRDVRCGAAPGVQVTVLYGGSLTLRESSGSYVEYALTLPSPIHRDEQHEYGVEIRITGAERMAPRYLCVPLRRYDKFDLRIRFDTSRLPRQVWVVTGSAGRAVDAGRPSAQLLTPDRFGEVHAEFHDLRIGFGYGIQWDI